MIPVAYFLKWLGGLIGGIALAGLLLLLVAWAHDRWRRRACRHPDAWELPKEGRKPVSPSRFAPPPLKPWKKGRIESEFRRLHRP